MSGKPSFKRAALSRMAANLSMGMLPFILLGLVHPQIPFRQLTPLWVCLFAPAIVSVTLWALGVPPAGVSRPVWHHMLSCLLLGGSLAVIPWALLGLPSSLAVMLAGFSIRWILYACETWELRQEDLRKKPAPCTATRIRRAITFITGAAIPILIIAGLSTIPLLGVSFVLTAFSQWSVACESLLQSGSDALRMPIGFYNEPGSYAG